MFAKLAPLPMKKLAIAALPKTALPEVILPVTAKLVNVPTLVMLGCAFCVTVPAVFAELAVAEFILVRLAPSPTK